jgi:3-dehydroquinate synthase
MIVTNTTVHLYISHYVEAIQQLGKQVATCVCLMVKNIKILNINLIFDALLKLVLIVIVRFWL